MTPLLWITWKLCWTGFERVMPCTLTPISLCALFLTFFSVNLAPSFSNARQRSKSRLSLWIDEGQVRTLTGYELEIKIITNGEVTPYLHNPDLFDKIVIPPEIDTVNLTWQAGLDTITIPCKGNERGVASLVLGLKIFDHLRRPLDGTPIHFRLKKQCMAFATSSLCVQNCMNGGTCNSHGVCVCTQGFYGPLCDIALCTPACRNNGTCISPSSCACPVGFYGNYCEKAVCGHVCQNGGQCLPEGFCWCSQGFYGDACEYSHCVPMCQNGGTCIGVNRCRCPPQYSGLLCEHKEEIDRPRRSKEPDSDKKNKNNTKQPITNLEIKLRKAEQRLLSIASRRAPSWNPPEEELLSLQKLLEKTTKRSLSQTERRYLVKFLTQQRKHLLSKDKTKLKRYKNLMRQTKKRQKKPRKRKTRVK